MSSDDPQTARFLAGLRQATEAPAPSAGFDARLEDRLQRRAPSAWWLAAPVAAALALGVGLWPGPGTVTPAPADAAVAATAADAVDPEDEALYASLDLEAAVDDSDEVFPEDYAMLAAYLDI